MGGILSRRGWLAPLAIAALGILPGAAPAEPTRLDLAPTSQLRLLGTTNIHDWQCRSTALEVTALVDLSPVEIRLVLDALETRVFREGAVRDLAVPEDDRARFTLAVPVDGLDCGNRRMERDVQKALDAAEHPEIRYRSQAVEEASVVPGDSGGPPLLILVVEGELSLAGRSRRVVFPVEGHRLDPDRLQLRGRIPLQMTDFGIAPPVALLGLIRADDRLIVEVDLLLEIGDDAALSLAAGP